MEDITLSAFEFWTMFFIIILLLIIAVVLSFVLWRINSRKYNAMAATGQSNETRIKSNRYNIHFYNRKSSDVFLRTRADFNFYQPEMTIKNCTNDLTQNTVSTNDTVTTRSEDQLDKASEKNINTVIMPPIHLREKFGKVFEELMLVKCKSLNKHNEQESYDLADLNKVKNISINANVMRKSISTPQLDIYDVVPSKVKPVTTVSAEDNAEYSLPKGCNTVVMDDDSGYLLPLSHKNSYVNANLK